jgi:hypothetical protein
MSKRPTASKASGEQSRQPVQFTSRQVLSQVLVIVVVAAVWAGLLAVALRLTSTGGSEVAEAPPAAATTATAEQAPSPVPTDEPAAATEPPATTATETQPPATATAEPPAGEPSPSATDLPAPTEPPAPAETPTTAPPAGPSFAADVLPVLQARCERCHGGNRTEEGLDLLSYAGVMAGSDNGPVVIPGDASASSLVELIISGDMPRRAPKLPAAEIDIISAWVDAGALDN